MNFFKNIIILIGVFLLYSVSVFANTPKEDDFIFHMSIEKGNFVPVSFLNTKMMIFSPEIWENDASVMRFVSTAEPLTDRAYKPEKLVSLSGANIHQAGRNSFVRSDVKLSIEQMAKDFSEHFGEPLIAISAFRSAEYQQRLWDLGRCNDGAFCAKPGYSEHQLGLAVDFFDATSEKEYVTNPRYKSFYEWMKKYAHQYGWTQSYKHGKEIDGYEIEPWHWRYIGVEMATVLYHLDISYTKYLNIMKSVMQY